MFDNMQNNLNLSASDVVPDAASLVAYWFMDTVIRNFPSVVSGYKFTGAEFPLGDLLLEGDEIERTAATSTFRNLVARRDGVLIFISSNRGTIQAHVAASEEEVAGVEVNRILDLVPHLDLPEDKVELGVWYLGVDGPHHRSKAISSQPWPSVGTNYPPEVAKALGALMKTTPPTDENTGRIILWYGPPGTGKTSALRTLTWEWRDWCDVHVISDPERLFAHPAYMLSVCGDDNDRWRLVVAEDSDAFLHAHKGGTSDMGRLLNFSDGIIGQGTKTIFLLTTNEPVGKLHPAVTRPGRCLAQIEFGTFTESEATAWLGGTYTPSRPQTLAELMEHRRTSKKITSESPLVVVGQYL